MQNKIQTLLATDPAWKYQNNRLVGEWVFSNFSEVRAMVGQLGDLADELNHHPMVTYGYNTVQIKTTTHDAGNTVTDLDIELAKRVSALVGE